MRRLSTEDRARIIHCLIEGCSLRSTIRMTGFAKKTVSRALTEVGAGCLEYHDKIMRNLPCKTIQVDEIWSFTYCKQANIPKGMEGYEGIGDTWTWVGIDSDTKLIPSWYVGDRSLTSAQNFINDLKGRLASRIQLTSDGYRPYIEAVEGAFGAEVDYSMLIKIFGKPANLMEARYSPPHCIGTRKRRIIGAPDKAKVSTSFVERQNLTIRMSNRRFTRLTNAFSKKWQNLRAAYALWFAFYNFCRVHQTLRVTPAMEAGLTDHIWTLGELLEAA